MIIQNIVDDFYRKLVPGKTVLILAGLDVDSLCALRSLIQLLQKDYIPFSLKPIRSKNHLFKTISEHKVSTSPSPSFTLTLTLPSLYPHLTSRLTLTLISFYPHHTLTLPSFCSYPIHFHPTILNTLGQMRSICVDKLGSNC